MTIAAEQMPDRGRREMPVHAQASLVRDAGDRPSGVSFSGGFRTDPRQAGRIASPRKPRRLMPDI